MAGKSIFDCDDQEGCTSKSVSERVQVVYDDDMFSFGPSSPKEQTTTSKTADSQNGQRTNVNQQQPFRKRPNSFQSEQNPKRFKTSGFKRPIVKKYTPPPATAPESITGSTSTGKVRANGFVSSANYTLLGNPIGQGTYGQVFRARQKDTNQIIAVKRMKVPINEMSRTEKFINREKTHLEVLRGHPNVVEFLGSYQERFIRSAIHVDFLFEYCPFDLYKVVTNKRIIFELAEVKSFLRAILCGIHKMHEEKIMHRDIKSENIFLTANGAVKIGDFGLSRKITDPSVLAVQPPQYTMAVVTLWYRAPELLFGDTKYTSQVDLWSVGCIMGEFWKRQAIMQGRNEINQIELISQLCGTIDEDSWPNVVHLKQFHAIKMPGPFVRRTRAFLTGAACDERAINLFDGLMEYDAEKRYDAWSALNDEFFFSDPLPVLSLKPFVERIKSVMH